MQFLEISFAEKTSFASKIFLLLKNEESFFQRDTLDSKSQVMSLAICLPSCCEEISSPASTHLPEEPASSEARFPPQFSHRATTAAARHGEPRTVGTKSYGSCHQIIVNTRSHTAADTQF